MFKRLWAAAHIGLTFASLGCCLYLLWKERSRDQVPTRPFAGGDPILRQFLKARWLGGDYELPPGRDHCGIAVLTFENGRFTGRRRSWAWSAPTGGSRAIPYLLMWGQTPAGSRVMTLSGGMALTEEKDDFFAKLDGPLLRCYGSSTDGEIRGYRVIGYAASNEAGAGKEMNAEVSKDVNPILRTQRHVAVLGVKTFDTEAEARTWANETIERADP